MTRALHSLWLDHGLGVRRLVRRGRTLGSLVKWRLCRLLGRPTLPFRVDVRRGRADRPSDPVRVFLADDSNRASGALDHQTIALPVFDGSAPGWTVAVTGDGTTAPATALESLELVIAAEAPDWIETGSLIAIRTDEGPTPHDPLGRIVPVVDSDVATESDASCVLFVASGPHRALPATSGRVRRCALRRADTALSDRPPIAGPPTVLFVVPFLAIGGAERLLFDLASRLGDARVLVATLEPHRPHLGETVSQCRLLTPHVYTLGDWMPRDAVGPALLHLVRRWSVSTVFCWNGATDFFDLVPDLRRRCPSVRLAAQLFNHEGGWIDRYTPRLTSMIHHHVAVNCPIEEAMLGRLGLPRNRVTRIDHGVEPASPASAEARSERRHELGLPDDAVVCGTFIRLHPQKRPCDIVRLAKRFDGANLWFLLVGGGPCDTDVDDEIRRLQPANLVKLPMRPDPERLYDAIDVCLMTSEYEGLPVFLLDGMARGLPVIATAVGDIPRLLEDGGGVCVATPGDLEAFESAIRKLADPAARRLAGLAARGIVVERFHVDRMADAYRSVIFPEELP